MLSVHCYHQPLSPLPSSHAQATRRHKERIVERGRSRTVSQAALTRKKSEERRKRAAIVNQHAYLSRSNTSTNTPRAVSQLARESHAVASHNAQPAGEVNVMPVASSSKCHLPLPSPPSTPRRPVHDAELPMHVADSTMEASDSCQRESVAEPYTTTCVSESSSEEDDYSLQDLMQQAYAACQISCLPNPGQNYCRCKNMHRARVLYLKTQGIEVTSDDDPRIDQVRDEDFEFIPGGQIVLDEESLAAINEERERREREAQVTKRRVCGQARDAQLHRVTNAEASMRQIDGSRSTSQEAQRLEFIAKRNQSFRSSASCFARQHTDLPEPGRNSRTSAFCSIFENEGTESKPRSVSSRELFQCLRGPLFPDSEPLRARSSSQERLLNSLLQPPVVEDTGKKRTINDGRLEAGPQACTYSRYCRNSDANSSCVACSVASESTISRTNSWASTTSGTSSVTCITSPPSSPMLSKLQLGPLIEDKTFREQILHSCCSFRRGRTTVVALADTPLRMEGCDSQEQLISKLTFRNSRECKEEKVASVLVSRVRQSIHGLVGFASKMQQSYLRTIQFAITLPSEMPPQKSVPSNTSLSPSKPYGYRASASDVRLFSPYPVSGPTRDLNLSSDLNIQLVSTRPELDTNSRPRVFAPLAFVPPSPLRPREPPLAPEWRLRPVANPCTLRLKAHANCLYVKGIPWEGRAHVGSLGCGRDRLTGIAFEGLGGSRLAFEAK